MAKKKWLSPAGRKMKSSMIKEYGKKKVLRYFMRRKINAISAVCVDKE